MPDHDVYTHGHEDAVLRSHRWRTAANSAAYLLPHLRPGLDLLDVGCGPGTLTVDLARHVAPGRVLGIDASAEVVDEARSFAAEADAEADAGDTGGAPAVEFVAGDFRELAGDRRYDVVHAHQVLHHVREPVEALRAMAALARPGGLVADREADYSGMFWAPAVPGLDRWREVFLAVMRRNGADADAGRQLPAWAAAAGLEDVTYTTSTWTFATPDEREWWGGMWAERTVASSFGAQAVEYGIATAAELEGIAEAWRSWAAAPGGVFVTVHGELLARV